MATTNADARQQVLDALGEATDALGNALALLGTAYERLDDRTADQLEEELFRPVRTSYGRAQRTYADFAARYELPSRKFEPGRPGSPSQDARHLIDAAVEAVAHADTTLSTLQDSMLPVEFGDADLRAGLQAVREQVSGIRGRARELVRALGR